MLSSVADGVGSGGRCPPEQEDPRAKRADASPIYCATAREARKSRSNWSTSEMRKSVLPKVPIFRVKEDQTDPRAELRVVMRGEKSTSI